MTKNKMKFKKGDMVEVLVGKDKGKRGHILKVFPQTMQVKIDGLNLINKRMKKSMENPNPTSVKTEMPLHVSNVSHIDPRTDLRTKVGFKFDADGKKIRYSKRTGETL